MSNYSLYAEHDVGESVELRIYNTSGQVLDHNDQTFKSIGSATTPGLAATELTGLSGTGRSGFMATIDLADVNSGLAAQQFVAKWFDDPAITALPVTGIDAVPFTAQLSEFGGQPIIGHARINVTSTEGDAANVMLWLTCGGHIVDIAGATCSVDVRELSTAAPGKLFNVTEADNAGAAAINVMRLELSQATPGFTSDRIYSVEGTITLGSVAYEVNDAIITFG